MKSFREFLEDDVLVESITDYAREMMKTGKYDPGVRGSAAQFSRDLIASGKTTSPTTATHTWKKVKHLHPDNSPVTQVRPVKSVNKPTVAQQPAKQRVTSTKTSTSGSSVITRDGDVVKVGDIVGFKRDIENTGRVVKIAGNTIHAKVFDSDTGERYIVQLDKYEIWKEY